MQQIKSPPPSHAEWLALVREGCSGNGTAFQLRLSRLIARLRREKSPLAAMLSEALATTSDSQMTLARDAGPSMTLSPVDAETNLALTSVQFPALLPQRPIWTAEIEAALVELVHEWQHADRLFAANLEPSRTVLLSGPPGVGKTLAATYLAEQLGFPLVTLNLATSVNSLLGKTGNNLVKVVAHAKSQPCVLLLDEFDAFAKRRDDGQDVGELKRVVNILLKEIDDWPATSLLIAATNHEELLDRAVFRRFDLWLRFPDSTAPQIEALLESLGCQPRLAAQIAPTLVGKPLSDATRLVQRAKRQVTLHGSSFEEVLQQAVLPHHMSSQERQRLLTARRLHAAGKSMRAIAEELGVHASTVSRMLKTKE